MTLIWTFFALLLCGMLELLLGVSGFYVPLMLLGMFYFGAFRHWRFALLVAMFIGSAVEMSYGRAVPICLILMPLLTMASKFWRWMGGTAGMLRQCVPGMFVGLFGGIAGIILKNRIMGTYEGAWRLGFMSASMGFVLFPVMCGIFDMVAGWMALNRYTRLGSGRRDEWLWQQEEYDLDEDFID